MTSPPADSGGAPRGVRRELAEGDGLTRYSEGTPFPLRFDSRREWEGWRAREEGDQIRATFAGTPVRVEDTWYEVVRAEQVAGRFVYYLAPWDERQPLRAPQELSAEACRREHERQRQRARRQETATLLLLLTPFVGLLPAEDQERIERQLGLPAVRTTLLSGLTFFVPALVLSALGIAVVRLPLFAAQNPGLLWIGRILPLSVFVFVDAAVRLVRAVTGEPAGSLPVVLVVSGWRQLLAATARRSGRARRASAGAFAGVRDELRELPARGGEPAGLEIVSRLPKPHWTLHSTPIRWAGAYWAAVERQEIGVGAATRHRFVLRPYPDEVLRAPPVDYAPDEVERLHRRQVLADRQMWIALGGSLWGMLDARRQAALARLYDYDPALQTRRSTVVGVIFGTIAAALALYYVAGGSGKVVDLVMLLGGGAAAVESLVRRRRLARGVVSGSFLGLPLRPFAWLLRRGLGA
ncbi:MAG TPA: hypothetical protein VGV61_00750 [Thermoanaerobaculia bacterium]|nr:hypothetical protein [Thermoanaerobaculia bacterium]